MKSGSLMMLSANNINSEKQSAYFSQIKSQRKKLEQ